MPPICQICQGAGIVSVTAALILQCPVALHRKECPYLPPHQHTHEEVYVPPQYSAPRIVVATPEVPLDHPLLLGSTTDPHIEGYRMYYIDLTASPVTT